MDSVQSQVAEEVLLITAPQQSLLRKFDRKLQEKQVGFPGVLQNFAPLLVQTVQA